MKYSSADSFITKTLFGCLMFGLGCGVTPTWAIDYQPTPTDLLASSATKNVYTYLATRRGQSQNRMIEGQHLGGINQIVTAEHPDAAGLEMTSHLIDGKLPGFVGVRYDSDYKQVDKPYPYVLRLDYCTTINNELIEIWNTYQPIIQVTAIPRNPWAPNKGREPDNPATQKISILLSDAPDTPEKRNFWTEIDLIADALQQLENAGIPIIFRPFAEFNQANKYYYAGQNSTDFKKLWIEVYNHYVTTRELHNLLFCWEVWALNRKPADAYPTIGDWYPYGYVDVVAGAYYFQPESQIDYLDDVTGEFSFDNSDPEDQGIYDFLTGQDRPFGAAQYGLNQGTGMPGDHDFTLKFMDYSEELAFAYYWDTPQEVQEQLNKVTFVNEPRIATANDLPAFSVAEVILEGLDQTYDGTPRVVTATTEPADLSVSITYDGSSLAPTVAGSYEVVGSVTAPFYTGSATGTLVVAKAAQSISFPTLGSIYYGEPAPALTAEATSGGSVVFSVVSGPADIVGSSLVYDGAGTVIIAADEAGGTNYEAAPTVQSSLVIQPSFYSWIENDGEPLEAPGALDDDNEDGVVNLLAYGLGLSPTARALPTEAFSPGLPYVALQDGDIAIEFVIDSNRTDIEVFAEVSTDLQTWFELPYTVVGTSGNWQRCRAESAIGAEVRQFLRVRVEQIFSLPVD